MRCERCVQEMSPRDAFEIPDPQNEDEKYIVCRECHDAYAQFVTGPKREHRELFFSTDQKGATISVHIS